MAKKKTTKKAPARKPKRSPVIAPETAVETQAAVPESEPKKKKPKRRAVTADEVAGMKPEPEAAPESEPEEEVITAVEVELRETVYDLLAKEAQRRKVEPGECAAMLIEMSLTSIASPAPTRAAGNLVDEDDEERDAENDAVLEDPAFQDSIEQLVQGGV